MRDQQRQLFNCEVEEGEAEERQLEAESSCECSMAD